jgi:hypothetical protein
MYWERNGDIILTPQISFLVKGTNFDVTLTLCIEAGESVKGAGLVCIESDFAGIITAKLSGESVYIAVGDTLDTAFYIGDMAELTEIDIDFRVNVGTGEADGLYVIPIQVVYGLAAAIENPYFSRELTSYFNGELTSYFRVLGTI